MTPASPFIRYLKLWVTVSIGLSAITPKPLAAQESGEFDPYVADAEIADLRTRLSSTEASPEFLALSRTRVSQIVTQAEGCAARFAEEQELLEARRERLTTGLTSDAPPALLTQRSEVEQQLEEATTRQVACADVADDGSALIVRIAELQNQLAQQFLSYRGESVIRAARDFPARLRSWPGQLREANNLSLVDGLTPLQLLWYLVGGGILAAGIGVFMRQRFQRWFAAGGGPEAKPQMRYLFPKPLAEYSPSLLSGLAFVLVLFAAIESPSLDLAVIRIALGIFLFGLGCVVIDWATGPLSPSASVKGLIPHHVKPLRLRLRLVLFTLIASFVVLGTNWLQIRMIGPEVTGRAMMIFLVASALLATILYVGKIPGVRRRFRLVRTASVVGLLLGIVAIFLGYHNFAGYVIHGITRSALALSVLWILIWLVSTAFEYLMSETVPAAANVRRAFGTTRAGSRSGLGFMQLIADLVLWLSLVVYLIYVWDEAGTTLDSLNETIVRGITVGDIQLVPAKIIGGILWFAALLIVIGWIKRWIDRRWLQHIIIERGAREALITLFGYVAFVIALLVGLTQAGVDLRGLAIVSGALALGIGFGLQEIANNFVSGLILLFERPIRAGDFVTVGEIEGFVRKIKIRATEIETLDNQNVLVPNSELVSGRVTNWVLHDTHGRLRVTVGVAYGSDIDMVREILEQVAREHPEVITDGRAPAPRALFMGFGDSSLDFELRCRINRIERRFSVTSDINFAVDAAFREAGIPIPFPQRDLHIVSYPEPATADAAEDAGEETLRARALAQLESVTRQHQHDVVLAADIAEVWRVLTDAEALSKWLGAEVTLAPYIGGAFDITTADGQRQHGRIDVFIPPQRMRLVQSPQDGEDPLPSGPITTLIVLRDVDGKTSMNVTVSGFPDSEDWEEDYNRSESRWQNALVELADLVGRK
ncbi:MAG: mechanosensitive ion channel domain-containing protein [Pseudomonadota bacterium]